MYRWLFVSLLFAQFLFAAPLADLTTAWHDDAAPHFEPANRTVVGDGTLGEPPGDKEEDPPPSNP
jgi:hypothetical protein